MKFANDYRPDIDGLRAVAVLAVLLFHYGATWLPGGFAGVDVFFVISGYLITKHLAEDISRNGYAIGPLLARFYDKRIRRILPALVVVLAATLGAGWFILTPGDFASTGLSASYSAFGLGNLYFYWNTGYFDQQAELQPLLHLWSLGVEEQFYFVWPVLLALIMWLSRGRKLAVGAIIFTLIVVGLGYSMQRVAVDPKGAFFLPLPRAWELGIGGLLAFLPEMRSRWLSQLAGVVGILLISGTFLTLKGTETSLALSMLPAVAGSALLIWPRVQGGVSSLLSLAPMRFVGLISYSLYLWHWPVIVLFRHYNFSTMPTLMEAAVLAVISFVLAYASWRFVEGPARRLKLPSFTVIAAGLGVAAVVASAGQVVTQNAGFAGRVSPEAEKLSSLDVMWQWDCPQQVNVPELGGTFCAFGAPWATAKVRGVLWGDSHAEHFAPITEAAIGDRSISVLLYLDCPAALGGAVRRVWPQEPDYVEHCASMRQRGISWLAANDIKLVLLAASWGPLSTLVSQDGTLPSAMSREDLVVEGVSDLVDKISKKGRFVVLLGQVPSMPPELVPCGALQAGSLLRSSGICARIENGNYEYDLKPYLSLDDKFAAVSQVTVLSPARALCKDGLCPAYLDGEFLSRDGNHIRRNLSPETRHDYADLIGLTGILQDVSDTSSGNDF